MRKRWLFVLATAGVGAIVLASSDAQAAFASHVVSSTGLSGSGLYNDPAAVLGAPTTEYVDNFSGGSAAGTYKTAMAGGAFNLTPDGKRTVTSIGSGIELTVGFDNAVNDDPLNPYGIDLLVFGNSFLTTSSAYTPSSNMESLRLAGALASDPSVVVSVAQSVSGPWFSYATRADQLFPTQAYTWDREGDKWGAPQDFTKPADPSLTLASFRSGMSVADAIDLYDGSGGGTGYDLGASGFSWIKYVRFTYAGAGPVGDIDAIADVSAVPEPATVMTLGVICAAALLHRRRRV